MAELTMRFKLSKSGKISNKQPIELIKQVVGEIESGIRLETIQVKYGKIQTVTLKEWVRRYGSGKEIDWGYRIIPSHVKRQAVYEIESGLITTAEAMKKYQVSEKTVRLWLKNHKMAIPDAGVASEPQPDKMDDKQRKELLQQMNELKLKITALETMIDLAEEHYNFPIRKKFGTKQ